MRQLIIRIATTQSQYYTVPILSHSPKRIISTVPILIRPQQVRFGYRKKLRLSWLWQIQSKQVQAAAGNTATAVTYSFSVSRHINLSCKAKRSAFHQQSITQILTYQLAYLIHLVFAAAIRSRFYARCNTDKIYVRFASTFRLRRQVDIMWRIATVHFL